MNETTKNMSIGILVCGAVALVVWVLLFLHPSIGDGKNRLRVRFPDIEKVAVGTRVTFAGKPIGEVIAIHLIPEARTGKEENQNEYHNEIYAYELTLAFDSKVHIYDTDEISIKTSGLMGEKTVSITPRPTHGQVTKPLGFNALTYSGASGSVEETFAQIKTITEKMGQTMDEVKVIQESAVKALDSVTATSNELNVLIRRANDADIVGSTKSLITKTEQQVDKLGIILTKATASDSTFGKIFMDDDLYLKGLGVLSKADVLMNDVNHYGPLFHLDKGWQRERRKRIAELERLESPAAFQAYVNEEMGKITTSIARVSMALEKADNGLVSSNAKVDVSTMFAELLSQIDALQNNLKMFAATHATSCDDIAEADAETDQHQKTK